MTQAELADMDLAYIGGLLGLDLRYDEEARHEVFSELGTKRAPSPDRKG